MSEEAGLRMQDTGGMVSELGFLSPESRILNPETARRLQWRCRRGLLELDIVLGRFVGQQYAGLDEAQRAAFDALLDIPDTELWDMIAGRRETAPGDQQALLEKIRAV